MKCPFYLLAMLALAASPAAGAGTPPRQVNRKAVDSTQTVTGVTLRESFAARKDAGTHWHLTIEQSGVKYFERDKDVPAFMGTKVDKIVAAVGQKSGRVALIALQIDENRRCQSVADALRKAWGEPVKVRDGVWQWLGDKVDVSQENDPSGDCTMFFQDRGYDDRTDTFSQRR